MTTETIHYCRDGDNKPACRSQHLDDGFANDEHVLDVNCLACKSTAAYEAARRRHLQVAT